MSLCFVELFFLTLLGLHELFLMSLCLVEFFLTLLGLHELLFNVSMFG